MTLSIPVQFPPSAILDRDGFVWAALPPGTGLSGSRILGTCSVDPSQVHLQQVTVEQGTWRLDLISPGQAVPFPHDHAFEIAVVGLEQHAVRARSTVEAPVRITVHVQRSNGGAARDDRGRLLRLPEPITFQLVLFVRDAEETPS
jgi:hypothetical protein